MAPISSQSAEKASFTLSQISAAVVCLSNPRISVKAMGPSRSREAFMASAVWKSTKYCFTIPSVSSSPAWTAMV